MTGFLNTLKADLLDRRLLPLLALVGVALAAALGYAILGGGSSSPTPSAVPHVSVPGGIVVTPAAANPNAAIAETASGTALQRGGATHDPFKLLPGAIAASTTTTSSSKSSTVSSTSSAGTTSASTGSSSAGTQPTTPSTTPSTAPSGSGGGTKGESVASAPTKPSPPEKHKVVVHFHVSAEFGPLPLTPEGTPAAPAQLKPYADLKLNEPLPAKNPQLVYLGVVLSTGKDAVFGLTGESILHGEGRCLPSTSHCQAIELAPGQLETLESFEANGAPVSYQLKLASITKTVAAASAARAHAASASSKRALALLRRAGLAALAGLRYSSVPDALVPVHARAHSARRAAHRR